MTAEPGAPSLEELAARIEAWSQSGLRVLDQLPQVLPPTVKSVTTTYQVVGFDRVIVADATAAPFTVTLPNAVGRHGQQSITVKRLNAGANAVTVGSAGGTIDGAATQALATQYAMLTVVSDGQNWYKVA